jgi:hypothetical protein
MRQQTIKLRSAVCGGADSIDRWPSACDLIDRQTYHIEAAPGLIVTIKTFEDRPNTVQFVRVRTNW